MQEVNELHKQSSGSIDVEVDVAPTVNLGKAMEDMRTQYEKMIDKQRLEAKFWFDNKVRSSLEINIKNNTLEKNK